MTTATHVKICGLTRVEDVGAAVDAGASYLGFVFFPGSKRAIDAEAAAALVAHAPVGVCPVGLFVNAGDDEIAAVLERTPLSMLQLHGAETPDRIRAVRARFGLPVMKAHGVAVADDVDALDALEAVADQLLVDAKPPKGAIATGGHGVAFDWSLLSGRRWRRPWMLAGGLTPENVAEAARRTGAGQVDVSSGVEAAPGIKDAAKMRAFVAAARAGDRVAAAETG